VKGACKAEKWTSVPFSFVVQRVLYCLVIGDLYMCFAQSIDVQLPVLARVVIPYCYNFSCETCKWSICMCVCVFITIKYVKWLIFFQLLDAVN